MVRPCEDSFSATVVRDGWVLLEVISKPDGDIEGWLRSLIRAVRTEHFHARFHEIVQSYDDRAPGLPCVGDCPWTCPQAMLWDACFNRWAWFVPSEMRARGCMMFRKDPELAPAVIGP